MYLQFPQLVVLVLSHQETYFAFTPLASFISSADFLEGSHSCKARFKIAVPARTC
jgi:hypothetical protein